MRVIANYRNRTQITGELIEETATHYHIKGEYDQYQLDKELTTIAPLEQDYTATVRYYSNGTAVKWTVKMAEQAAKYQQALRSYMQDVRIITGTEYFSIDGVPYTAAQMQAHIRGLRNERKAYQTKFRGGN